MKENVLNFLIYKNSKDECISNIYQHVNSIYSSSKLKWLACFNPHSYYVSLSDKQFSDALANADWLIPDGQGVVLASQLKKRGIVSRITGSDIFYGVICRLQEEKSNLRVFFLGSTQSTLDKCIKKTKINFPDVQIAGSYSPPFKSTFDEVDNNRILSIINSSSCDILWIGMTAPKQEKWIQEHKEQLINVRFVGCIGAVFDFHAENVYRPSIFFQNLGLEWFVRLIQEPRRLWKRTFISAFIFCIHVLTKSSRK